MISTISQRWKQIGKDLHLRIESPYRLFLKNGAHVEFEVLVKDFGAPLGMLITTDFNKIRDIDEELAQIGYGFSVMSHPSGQREHNSESYKDILNDWGWSGNPMLKPLWIVEPEGTEINKC